MAKQLDIFYPRHLCQYVDPRGKAWTDQINGGRCDCWATIGAEMVRAATHGRRKPTPPDIRKRSGNPVCPGHIGYIQTAAKTYGVTVEIPHATATGWGFGVPWAEVEQRLAKGQIVALPVTYGALPRSARAKTSFVGHHMFGLMPYVSTSRQVYADDPIRTQRYTYALDDLKTAARVLAQDLGFPKGNVIAAFVQGVKK